MKKLFSTLSVVLHFIVPVHLDYWCCWCPQVVVAAVDSGAQTRQTSTTTLTVVLQDVNNKPPKFSQVS